MIKDFKIIGDKICIKNIEEEITGSIILPEKRSKIYAIGTVHKVGDGYRRALKQQIKMFLKEGDTVLYQINPMMATNNLYKRDNNEYLILMQSEFLFKLKEKSISIENIEVVGDWILLEAFQDVENTLILPESYNTFELGLRYKALQVGCNIDFIKEGQEVIPEKNRLGAIDINSKRYFYLDKQFVCGLGE